MAIIAVAIVAAVQQREQPAATPAAGPVATAPSWNGRVNYILFAAGAERGRAGLDVTGVMDDLTVGAGARWRRRGRSEGGG